LQSGGSGPLAAEREEFSYVYSGNVLQRSPMLDEIDGRLNYDIYKQDSFCHRNHLLEIIKKKKLKKPSNRGCAVSYLPTGHTSFKVGYGGNLRDIYASNPDTYLNEVRESKSKKR
jgi:hypothetical protein